MTKSICTLLCLFLLALCAPAQAAAEACFPIDIDALDMQRVGNSDYVRQYLSGQAQGLRVSKYISDSDEFAARVRLTIMQAETSAVVFDKNYGYVSGTFDSGDIYLPYVDNNTIPYLITLSIEDWVYALPFMQLQSRLTHNSACTAGLRLRDANPALTDTWVMGTMLDLDALRMQGSLGVTVCASNQYQLGQADLTLVADQLSVSITLRQQANVEVHTCAVYLFGNVADLHTADPAAMGRAGFGLGQPIDVSGMHTALLYLPMILSYDPAGLDGFTYDPAAPDVAAQWALWQQNLLGQTAQTSATALATPEPEPTTLPAASDPLPADVALPSLPTDVPPSEVTVEIFP